MYLVTYKKQRPPRPSRERGVSDQLWTIIESCWAHDPLGRPTSEAVLDRMKEMDFGVEPEAS